MSKKALEPVYIFAGEETFLIEEEIAHLKNALGENTTMNLASFNAEEVYNMGDIIELCNTLPFLSERRLVIVRNLHKLPLKHQDQILAYVKNPAKTTTLLMTIVQQRSDKKSMKGPLQQIVKKACLKQFDPLKGKSVITWIQNRVKSNSKEIDRDAAFLLADITGSNAWFLSTEIEKLCLYIGKRSSISLKDVEYLVMRSYEPSIFSFLDALFDRKKDALIRLHEIEQAGVAALDIVSRIENQILQHYQILIGKQENQTRIHPFVQKKITSRKALWKASHLEWLLTEIRRIERHLKTGITSQPYVAIAETIGSVLLQKTR